MLDADRVLDRVRPLQVVGEPVRRAQVEAGRGTELVSCGTKSLLRVGPRAGVVGHPDRVDRLQVVDANRLVVAVDRQLDRGPAVAGRRRRSTPSRGDGITSDGTPLISEKHCAAMKIVCSWQSAGSQA